MQEEWKDIVGFEGVYYISNMGRVRKHSKVIAASPNKKRRGYCYSNLEYRGKRKNSLVHQLVAKHFIPNPESKRCVNHIDFNVSNNRLENLEWATHKENITHSVKAGRMARQRGELCGNSKLTLDMVRKIREDIKIGAQTYLQIAAKYNTNYSNIAHIKRGSRWGFSV